MPDLEKALHLSHEIKKLQTLKSQIVDSTLALATAEGERLTSEAASHLRQVARQHPVYVAAGERIREMRAALLEVS